MFTIDYGVGWLGGLVIALLIGAGVIVAIFLFAAAKQARDVVVEEDEARDEAEGRDEHTGPIA